MSGQKIVDLVERKSRTCTVKNLPSILLIVKMINTSATFSSFFLSVFLSLSEGESSVFTVTTHAR